MNIQEIMFLHLPKSFYEDGDSIARINTEMLAEQFARMRMDQKESPNAKND